MPENTTLFSLSEPSRELPREVEKEAQSAQQEACPRCKTVVPATELLNKKGKKTWCSACRLARREALKSISSRKKALPIRADRVHDDLDALIEAARLEGQFKAKALMSKGAVSKKAWGAAFRSRRAVQELVSKIRSK